MLKLGAVHRPRRLRDLKNLPDDLKSCPIFRDILSYALQMSHRGPIEVALAAASAYHHPDRYPHDVRTDGDFLKLVCLRNLLAVANETLHCLARGRSHSRHLSSWVRQDASRTGTQPRERTTLRGSPSPKGHRTPLPEASQPASPPRVNRRGTSPSRARRYLLPADKVKVKAGRVGTQELNRCGSSGVWGCALGDPAG